MPESNKFFGRWLFWSVHEQLRKPAEGSEDCCQPHQGSSRNTLPEKLWILGVLNHGN